MEIKHATEWVKETNQKFSNKANEDGNAAHQKLRDAAKAVLRGVHKHKFLHRNEIKISNNLTLCHRN